MKKDRGRYIDLGYLICFTISLVISCRLNQACSKKLYFIIPSLGKGKEEDKGRRKKNLKKFEARGTYIANI